MTLNEAFDEFIKKHEAGDLPGVFAIGIGVDKLYAYAKKKTTVPDFIGEWPVKLVITSGPRPATEP